MVNEEEDFDVQGEESIIESVLHYLTKLEEDEKECQRKLAEIEAEGLYSVRDAIETKDGCASNTEADAEGVCHDGVELKKFIRQVGDMVDGKDKTAVLNWLAFAQDISGADMEDYSNLATELKEIYFALCYVKNNFNHNVLQKSLHTTILGDEIVYGAMCFSAGYSIEDVEKLAGDGILGCGYIPLGEDEKSSLSLICVSETDTLFIAKNKGTENLFEQIVQAATTAVSAGRDIADALRDGEKTGLALNRVESPEIAEAVKLACSSSTAFDVVIVCDPSDQKVVQFKRADLAFGQGSALFHSNIYKEDCCEELTPQM